jgi:hypothetical protein
MNNGMTLKDAMAKYSGGNGGNTSFFSLKNDGESATVRFLYGDNPEELDWFVVYKVSIGGKDRYVKQNRENDPLAMAGFKPSIRGIIQLVKENEPSKVLLWDRGRPQLEQLIVLMNQYGPLKNMPYNITRKGAKGSKETSYFIMPLMSQTQVTLADRVKLVDGKNGYILELTDAEMTALVNGTFVLNTQPTQPTTPQGFAPTAPVQAPMMGQVPPMYQQMVTPQYVNPNVVPTSTINPMQAANNTTKMF